jgi:hypothetical protein
MRSVRILVIAAVVAFVGITAHPAQAKPPAPLRSGRILSGVLTTSPAWHCGLEPDCVPWLASGCDPALASPRVSWLSAIVDVADLADGTTPRTFTIKRTRAGRIIGGASFQFWTRDCEEVHWLAWHTFWECRYGQTPYGFPCESKRSPDAVLGLDWIRATFPLPPEVAWMTISANDNLNIAWTVR